MAGVAAEEAVRSRLGLRREAGGRSGHSRRAVARHLGGKVRELRIPLHPVDARVTYWLAPGRRVVLLTVFRKTKAQETAEVERARRVQKECEASHGHAEEVFDREA